MTELTPRLIEIHEVEAFAACQAAAFSARYPADRLESLAKELELDRTFAVFEGTEVIGTTTSFRLPMTLPGLVRADVASVTDVSVAPTHRRRGLLRAMMRRQLDELHSRGEALAVLFSSEGGIYGRFGYGPATFAARYVVDKRLGRLLEAPGPLPGAATDSGLPAAGPGSSVRLVEQAQAAEAFPAVFAAYAPTRVGEIDRPAGEWAELLGDLVERGEGHRFYVCYEQAGSIDGYAVYHVGGIDPVDRWRRGVFLEELCSLSDAAYVALWRYLLGIDLADELRTYGRPVDEPVRYLFEDQRQFRTTSWRDRSWLRLVDVQEGLGMRRYEDDGVLVIELHDPFCAWNEGRFVLSVDGDGATSVERGAVGADLVLSADALGSGYLGAVSFAAMAAVGRVTVRTDGAAEKADRMFAARRAPFCTTHF